MGKDDTSTGSYYAVPGDIQSLWRLLKSVAGQPRTARKPRCTRDPAVSGHVPSRDGAYDIQNVLDCRTLTKDSPAANPPTRSRQQRENLSHHSGAMGDLTTQVYATPRSLTRKGAQWMKPLKIVGRLSEAGGTV